MKLPGMWKLTVPCVWTLRNQSLDAFQKSNQLMKQEILLIRISLNVFTSISVPWLVDLEKLKTDRLFVLGIVWQNGHSVHFCVTWCMAELLTSDSHWPLTWHNQLRREKEISHYCYTTWKHFFLHHRMEFRSFVTKI